ncbi:MAG: type II toxin-antitoxin system RelB/DinJ family antitoxin [Holophagaceae bacterium]|jgi:DNA-damage-inducible protein J|nr:type II toxin-antitoxin system RelB/DinJ family antitoxin [Holophagaceae bacterium]
MAQTDLLVQMDEELKASGEELFDSLGMNLSTAISVFVSQSVRLGKIPFEISLNMPNAETLEAMEEVEQWEKNPESIGKTYTDIGEMFKELLS